MNVHECSTSFALKWPVGSRRSVDGVCLNIHVGIDGGKVEPIASEWKPQLLPRGTCAVVTLVMTISMVIIIASPQREGANIHI